MKPSRPNNSNSCMFTAMGILVLTFILSVSFTGDALAQNTQALRKTNKHGVRKILKDKSIRAKRDRVVKNTDADTIGIFDDAFLSSENEIPAYSMQTESVYDDEFGFFGDVEGTPSNPCGDGIKADDEECESDTIDCTDANGIPGFPGFQTCLSDCSGYSECLAGGFCGDGFKIGNEVCDSDSTYCLDANGNF